MTPRRARSLRRLAYVVTALAAAACVRVAGGPPPAIAPDLVWPAPPAAPRIRYVQAITEPRDLGLQASWWRRTLASITGATPPRMVRPTGVAASAGRIAVADPGLPGVHLFGRERYEVLVGTDTTAFVAPVGVALTDAGELFVADSALGRVVRFDAAGTPIGALHDPELLRPAGLAWNERDGRLYVADALSHRIAVYDRAGTRLAAFGRRGSGPGELNYPGFVTTDLGDQVLVSDALNFRVTAFSAASGTFAWSFGHAGDGSGDFARPKGIAVDAHGHIYVADALFDAVQVFDRDGRLLLAFGSRGRLPGQFSMPAGIAVDAANRIYVADAYNRRVQVFEYVGSD